MSSGSVKNGEKWYSNGRWAYVLALVGGLMIAFVIATNGAYGAWSLWIAIPLLMIALAYIYIVNALAYVWGKTTATSKESGEEKDNSRKS